MANSESTKPEGQDVPLSIDELDVVTGGSNPAPTAPPQPPPPGQAGNRQVGTGPGGATPPPGPGDGD